MTRVGTPDVGFDARSARLARLSGWERYARNLWLSLGELGSLEVLDLGGSARTAVQRVMSDWVTVPRRSASVDIALFPTFPPTPCVRDPVVYVLHDLTWWLYPEAASTGGRVYYRRLAEMALRRAAAVVTDSSTARNDILGQFDLDPERVHVCYPGVAIDVNPERSPPPRTQRPYLLVVATAEPRKNLPALIRGYEAAGLAADVDLVLVGRPGWGPNTQLVPGCRPVGSVSDAELVSLYKGALALIAPSLYEGFGLPLLEAMRLRVPVFCSNIPVFREVSGSYAEFFNPREHSSIVSALTAAVAAPKPPPEADVWASSFTWTRAATEMADLIGRCAT